MQNASVEQKDLSRYKTIRYIAIFIIAIAAGGVSVAGFPSFNNFVRSCVLCLALAVPLPFVNRFIASGKNAAVKALVSGAVCAWAAGIVCALFPAWYTNAVIPFFSVLSSTMYGLTLYGAYLLKVRKGWGYAKFFWCLFAFFILAYVSGQTMNFPETVFWTSFIAAPGCVWIMTLAFTIIFCAINPYKQEKAAENHEQEKRIYILRNFFKTALIVIICAASAWPGAFVSGLYTFEREKAFFEKDICNPQLLAGLADEIARGEAPGRMLMPRELSLYNQRGENIVSNVRVFDFSSGETETKKIDGPGLRHAEQETYFSDFVLLDKAGNTLFKVNGAYKHFISPDGKYLYSCTYSANKEWTRRKLEKDSPVEKIGNGYIISVSNDGTVMPPVQVKDNKVFSNDGKEIFDLRKFARNMLHPELGSDGASVEFFMPLGKTHAVVRWSHNYGFLDEGGSGFLIVSKDSTKMHGISTYIYGASVIFLEKDAAKIKGKE